MTTSIGRDLSRARIATTWAFAVQAVSLTILVTRTPAIKSRLDLSDAGLGLLLVLVPVVAAVGSVIAGSLSPRVGSKAVLRVSGPLVPLSVVVVGFSSYLWLTVGALVVFGMALGATDATMNMQATSVQHGYGRPIIASCYAWFSLASLIGAVLASGAAAIELSLGVFFMICAAIVVPVQVLVGRYLVTDIAVEQHREMARVPWAPIVMIGIGMLFASILESAAMNWSAVFLTDEVAATEAVAALGFGVYSLVLLLCRMAVDRLDVRFGPVLLIRASAIIGLVAVAIITTAPSPAIALVGFGVLGLGVASVFPLAFTAGASHDPDRSGRAVARVNVFNYAGVLIGAPLIGIVAEVSTLRLAFAILVVAPVAMWAVAKSYRTQSL